MRKKISIAVLLVVVFHGAVAQDISIVADYPEQVAAGQQFQVSWTINTGDGEFSEPSFQGFIKLFGPNTSYSSSARLINGKLTRESSYTYSYYLQAPSPGKYVIPPAMIRIRNKSYYSDSLRILVTGSASAQQGSAGNAQKDAAGETVDTSEDLFVNINLDRKEVFLGEHIVATVKIYSRIDLSGINEIKYPGFEGFLKTDLETPPLTSLRRETINGRPYNTGVIQQFLLYPQVSGEIDINPVQVSVLIQQRSGRSDPFFGDFFQTYTTVPRTLFSKAVKVKVNALPGTKPDDFTGFVGKASITATLNKDSVNVNDAVNLKIVISGFGNLKLANAPDIKFPSDVEVYDPKITDELKNNTGGTSGRKTFEYLLIPRHHGEFKIPPLQYSYFDISTRKYETLTTGELVFHARKVEGQSGGITVYGGVSKEDVKYLGKDIRFIKSNLKHLRKTDNIIPSKHTFYFIYVIALLIFLAVLIIRKEHVRRNADLVSVRNRKAGKVAARRLREAEKYLKEERSDRFYEEILKGIWGYLSDKLNIPVSELTRAGAVEALVNKGIPEEETRKLDSLIDKCEFARYAPASSPEEAGNIYHSAAGFIKYVENSIG